MSDETNTPTNTDEALQHPPMEDYSGDDQQSAHGTVQQPSAEQSPAAEDVVTDANELPADPSLGG